MKFEDYYYITLEQLGEEITKDLQVSLNKTPIFESPIFHETEYFERLNDIKTNHPFALERINDSDLFGVITIRGTQYRLHRKIDGEYTWDFFISGELGHEQMSAFIKYIAKRGILAIRGLWQIDFVVGLVKSLINDYYSKHYSILESDSIANSKGKKFFQNLAREYIQQGKKVTVSVQGKEIPYVLGDDESYWKMSLGVHSAEKIIVYNF